MSPQPNLNSEEYYEILGCPRTATDAQLKKAYRKLAVKWHPDKNPDSDIATKNFQKISEAYATLSDKKKRQLYDQYGKQGADASDQMPEGAGFPAGGMHFGGMGGGGGGMSQEDAQRLFSSFFGGSDPFGGGGSMFSSMGGGMGGPQVQFMSSSMGGGGGPSMSFSSMGGGGADPFSMMFGGDGGMPSGFASSFSQQAPPQKQYDEIPAGTVITLKDLVSASDLNGDRGTIKQYNRQTGRYVVQLEDDDDGEPKTMSIKPSNLQQHVQVVLSDIQSQPEFNNKKGTIISWIESKSRYNVYVTAMKKVICVKKQNVVFSNGTVAQITGVQRKPELNGKYGTIKGLSEGADKYDVQISESQIIRLKKENIHV